MTDNPIIIGRYDRLGTRSHWELRTRLGFDYVNKMYGQEKKIYEKIRLWNFGIQTEHLIQARR